MKFNYLEAIVFDPKWWNRFMEDSTDYMNHPLKPKDVVYYLGDIPNVPGHGIVIKRSGGIVTMVHPEDFRKAREEEL